MSGASPDPANCARLAQRAWLATFVWYLAVLLFSFGWAGPYIGIIYWSLPAVPLSALTWWWLRKAGSPPARELWLVVVAWLLIGVLVQFGELGSASAPVLWLAFLACGTLPLLLTWSVLKRLDDVLDAATRRAA